MPRTREDAIASAKDLDPKALHQLLATTDLIVESRATLKAQSKRRNEAVHDLVQAGVSYRDIGRLIEATPERARQLVAQHLGVHVNDLNPQTPATAKRH
jgi:lambda repressor-like predicted transcriptional regulator